MAQTVRIKRTSTPGNTWDDAPSILAGEFALNTNDEKVWLCTADNAAAMEILTDLSEINANATKIKIRANSAITKGQAVRFVSYNQTDSAIAVVPADNTVSVAIGIADADIAINTVGYCVSNGIISQLDTTAWTEGDILYVSTSGALTTTDPTSGYTQPIGYVVREHATNGKMMVNIDYPKQSADDVRYSTTESVADRLDDSIQNNVANQEINSPTGSNSLKIGTASASGTDAELIIAGARTGATGNTSVLTFQNDTAASYNMARIIGQDPDASHTNGNGQMVLQTSTSGVLAPAIIIDSGQNVDVLGDLTVSGDVIINGTTTSINTTTLDVEDKNIELGKVTTPTDVTADGGGITLLASTDGSNDKTILWNNSLDAWAFNQRLQVSTEGTGIPMLKLTADLGVNTRSLTFNAPAVDGASEPFEIQTSNALDITIDATPAVQIKSNGDTDINGALSAPSIDINSGNATIAADGDLYAKSITYNASAELAADFNTETLDDSGFYDMFVTNATTASMPKTGWNYLIDQRHRSDNGYRMQISRGFGTIDSLYHRAESAATWGSWYEIWDSNNFGKTEIDALGIDASTLNTFDDADFVKVNSASASAEQFVDNFNMRKYINFNDYDDATGSNTGLRTYVRDGVWNIGKDTSETNNLSIVLAGTLSSMTAGKFESTVVTGTAPLTVASTTLVTNLNADTVDGLHASDFLQSTGPETLTVTDTVCDTGFTGLNINYDVSGSDVQTADRNHRGLFIDVDSTATGGDTNNEHRLYGIVSDVRSTGDSDLIYGLNTLAIAQNTAGQTTNVYGAYTLGRADHTGTGVVTNVYGSYTQAQHYSTLDTASISATFSRAFKDAGATGTTDFAHGVQAEVEISEGAGVITNARAVSAIIDNNVTTNPTSVIGTSYLFYGAYSGTLPTNSYGIYVGSNVPNYFHGDVETNEAFVGNLLRKNDTESGVLEGAYRFDGSDGFWRGWMIGGGIITESAVNKFPRASMWTEASTVTDPSDLTFHIKPGNSGTLQYDMQLSSHNDGDIILAPDGTGVTSTNQDLHIHASNAHALEFHAPADTNNGFGYYTAGVQEWLVYNTSNREFIVSSRNANDAGSTKTAIRIPNDTAVVELTQGATTVAPAASDSSTRVATTAWVQGELTDAGGTTLDELTDTNLVTPSDGDVLTYDNATSKWLSSGDLHISGSFKTGNSTSLYETSVYGGDQWCGISTKLKTATLSQTWMETDYPTNDTPRISWGTRNTTGTSLGNMTFQGGVLSTTEFKSTIATGTAPFTVASTTKVTNLNADLLDGVNSSSFLRSDATDYLTATQYLRGDIVAETGYRNRGVFGTYVSTKTQHIWSMGTAYRCAADGSSLGNLYGIGYDYNVNSVGHGFHNVQNGVIKASIGSNIWTSGNVTAYSDERVKENLEKIPNALDKIMQINGYTYNRTDIVPDELEKEEVIHNHNKSGRHVGVIAQEVLKVLPEAVLGGPSTKEGSEDDHFSVAYGNLTALLIEGIKEQQAQIDELKKEINKLKGN